MRRLPALIVLASLAPALPAPAVQVSVPLEYQAKLQPGSPASMDAGPAFLADDAAQRWFLERRPDLAAEVFQRAMEAADRGQALLGYDDPRALRWALAGREDDEILDRPAALLAFVDRVPALTAKRPLFERAALEWSTLPEEAKALLARDGIDEALWRPVSVHRRRRLVEEAYETVLGRSATEAEVEAALTWLYTPQQMKITSFGRRIAGARRVAAALRRAREALGAAQDEDARLLLERAETSAEPAEKVIMLSHLSKRLDRDLTLDLPAPDVARLERSLTRELLAAVDRTEAGPELRRLYGRRPAALRLAALPAGAAAFNPLSRTLTIDSTFVAEVLAALGYRAADLLSDPAALRRVALFLAPTFAHEATHEAQDARPEHDAGFPAYAEESEVESFGVQTVVARALAAEPGYLETRRLVAAARPLVDLPAGGDAGDVRSWLRRGSWYADVPTAAGRAALAIERQRLTLQLDIVDRLHESAAGELALRRRGRTGALEDMTVQELRRQRDGGGRPLEAVAAAMAYLRRWEADLAALSGKLARSLAR